MAGTPCHHTEHVSSAMKKIPDSFVTGDGNQSRFHNSKIQGVGDRFHGGYTDTAAPIDDTRHEKDPRPLSIVGIGSPHGNDQAGWLAASRLAQLPDLAVDVNCVAEPSLLWRFLDGCQRLIVIDAIRAGARRGTVVRLEWPDPRIAVTTSVSSHGIGLGTVLQLAEKMERLPSTVVLFGFEVGSDRLDPLAPFDLKSSMADLEAEILREINSICKKGDPAR